MTLYIIECSCAPYKWLPASESPHLRREEALKQACRLAEDNPRLSWRVASYYFRRASREYSAKEQPND